MIARQAIATFFQLFVCVINFLASIALLPGFLQSNNQCQKLENNGTRIVHALKFNQAVASASSYVCLFVKIRSD